MDGPKEAHKDVLVASFGKTSPNLCRLQSYKAHKRKNPPSVAGFRVTD